MIEYRLLPAGENGVVVEFGNSISEEINQKVSAFCQAYAAQPIDGVTELVPTFRSVSVYYDCSRISYRKMERKIRKLISKCSNTLRSDRRVFVIPVCYDEPYAPDMEHVMAHTGLSREEIIRRHSGTDYLIYMLGFLPGFAYLGGLDPQLVTPRLQSPRTKIPAGSVGIGGEQTGIYPLDSPGGWQLIGKTPLKVYDAERQEPILYQAGDRIRFRQISAEEFTRIAEEVEAHTYQYQILETGVQEHGN